MKELLFASLLVLAGCHQNLTMSNQRKLTQWERSDVFRNGRVLQSPAPGTVSREQDTADVLSEKPPMNLALVTRGHERFDIFCSECHGTYGDGDGMVVQRGFPAPVSFRDARLVNAPDEHFVNAMTHGYGVMYSYADRIPPADRWAITAYIRALQRTRPPIASRAPAQGRAG